MSSCFSEHLVRPQLYLCKTDSHPIVATGLVDTLQSRTKASFEELSVANFHYVPSGAFYEQSLFGVAASALSLVNNLVATTLIACKAWQVAYLIRKYICY